MRGGPFIAIFPSHDVVIAYNGYSDLEDYALIDAVFARILALQGEKPGLRLRPLRLLSGRAREHLDARATRVLAFDFNLRPELELLQAVAPGSDPVAR